METVKNIWQFVLDNWYYIAPLIEALLRTIPTKKNISIIDNAWKLLNWIITNRRKPDGSEDQVSDTKNAVIVNIKKHILFALLIIPFAGSAQSPIIQQVRASMYTSPGAQDTAVIKTTRTSLQTANGNTSGLFFDEYNNKWRVWNGTTWVNWNNFTGSSGAFWKLGGQSDLTSAVIINGSGIRNVGFLDFLTFQLDANNINFDAGADVNITANNMLFNSTGGSGSGYFFEGPNDVYFGADFVHTFSNVNNFSVIADENINLVGTGTGTAFWPLSGEGVVQGFNKIVNPQGSFSTEIQLRDDAIVLKSFGNGGSATLYDSTDINNSAYVSTFEHGVNMAMVVNGDISALIFDGTTNDITLNGQDQINVSTVNQISLDVTGINLTVSTSTFTFTGGKANFNTFSSRAGINVGAFSGNYGNLVNGDIGYNLSSNEYRVVKSGTQVNMLTATPLTTNLILIANGAGSATNDSDLSFTSGNTLNTVNAIISNALTNSSLTSTRIPIIGTAGLFGDDSDLTFTGGNTLNTPIAIIGGVTYQSAGIVPPAAGTFIITATGNTTYQTTTDNQFASTQANGGSLNITSAGVTVAPAGSGDFVLPMNSGAGRYIIMSGLPTSAAGLPSGAVWSNAGILNVAP